MKRYFMGLCLAFLALTFASCSTIKSAQDAIGIVNETHITQNQLNLWKSAYDNAVYRPFLIYRYSDAAYTVPRRYCTASAPFTVASPCAKYSILAKVQPYLQTVDTAEVELQTLVTGCNTNGDQTACSGMPAAIKAFKTGVTAAKDVLQKAGVI